MEPPKPPRVFISYSWESEDHKSWVRYLGERLYEAGIAARLDQWFVQPGESFIAFMEQEVAAADFVLVVCTPPYAHKSDNRQGRVGYVQQIVSGRLMSGTARSKFIPILRKGGYEPGPDCAIPIHCLGIAWNDFRDDVAFEEKLEELIRVIFSKPGFAPPPLDARPSLETITATALNRIRLAEADESIEKGANVKTNFKEADIDLELDDATAYYDRGDAHFAKGDHDRAIAHYTRAIEIELAKTYVVCVYERPYSDKKYDRVIADCTEAIEIEPDDAYSYSLRGYAYFLKRDIDRAIDDYTKAIEIEPDDARSYDARGHAYFAKGDNDSAIADYSRILELEPDDVYAYVCRGLAHAAKGDNARAIADFRKSFKRLTDPDHLERVLRALRKLRAK